MGAKISQIRKKKSKIPNLGYELLRLIGHGIDDKVFECIDTKTKKRYALKLMEIKTTEEYQKTAAFRNILLKLKTLNHPNIMPIVSAEFQENKDYYGHTEQFLVLIMELSITSLENLINQRAKSVTYWNEKELAHIAYSLADGFEQAQRLGIPHRDVKDRNILVCGNNYVIADFGDSKLSSLGNFKGLDSLSASVSFMAPEVYAAFENARSTPDYDLHKADVYSLGLVLLKMAKLNLNSHREQRDIAKDIESIFIYPYMSYVIKKMLENKPEKRITWAGIKSLLEGKYPGIKMLDMTEDMNNNRSIIMNTFKANIENEEFKAAENLGKGYYDLGIYSEALRYFNVALDCYILARNSDEGILRYRSQIAACYRQLNLPKKAFENDYKALEILKKLRQAETTKAAIVYSSLATDHSMLDDYRAAIDYHKLALEIKRKSAGDDSFIVAETYINLAFEYDQLEEQETSLHYNTKALEILKKIFGKHIKHRSLAMVYEKIGENHSKLENKKRSIYFKQKALNIRRKIFGDQHPLIIETEHSIGRDYSFQGQHRQALESFNKAKALALSLYGESNQYYAQILEDLSVELHSMQSYSQALEQAKTCLKIREGFHSKDQEAIGRTMNLIGSIYFAMGVHNSAISFKKKALEYVQKFNNPDHPALAKYYEEIGDSYTMLGDKKAAITHKMKALDITEAIYEERNLITAEMLWSLANTYMQFSCFDEALDYQNRSLNMTERLTGRDSYDSACAHHRLGLIYHKKNNLDIAMTHFKKGVYIIEKLQKDRDLRERDQREKENREKDKNNDPKDKDLKDRKDQPKERNGKRDKRMLTYQSDQSDQNLYTLAVSDLYLDYGDALALTGDFASCLHMKNRSLDIRRELLGEHTIEVAKCLESIAQSYMKSDDFGNSIEYLEKAKLIYGKCFESDDNPQNHRIEQLLKSALMKLPSEVRIKSLANIK